MIMTLPPCANEIERPLVQRRQIQPLHWQVECGIAAIERCAPAWDELAHNNSMSPTADALWMRCFWCAFGDVDESLVLHSAYQRDALVAVLPLRRTGNLLRKWSSISNVHTPYSMFAIDEGGPEVATQIVDHLLASADLFELERMRCNDPLYTALIEAARWHRLPIAEDVQGGDHVIELFAPWDRFLLSLPPKMRRETARKMRQLERVGRVEFELIASEPELTPALEACFELETRGWKGGGGSPIKDDPRTLYFYTELARALAAAGRFALYMLKLDGAIIAYEYCLRAQGKIDQLKPSFDPNYSKYSPGNVLRYRILEKEICDGEISSYHLGTPAGWKYHWTKRVDSLVRLRIYGRGVRSRLGYYTGPQLRGALKKSATLRAAVGWVRRRG